MLPSMPILFTRDSQDAFGNKIEASTSFFKQQSGENSIVKSELPPPPAVVPEPPKVTPKENKGKGSAKKDQEKDEPPKINDNILETALVRSYYTKVQSRFSTHSNLPTNKFVQFQNILKTFDPTKETSIDLYRKIENLFGEEHKDIVEEFLLFLDRGQAAQIGRFMDHYNLTQMTYFIQLLQVHFTRKPTVLRKIMRALAAGCAPGADPDAVAARMRTRVAPHLRQHPRLAALFRSLFPDERPADSVYEAGADAIHEGFLTDDKGVDVWEFDEGGDKHAERKLEATDRLDTLYMHGRVYLQHGRTVRAARVSYPYSKEPYRVPPPHAAPKRPPNTAPKTTPKRTKKQKSPTKTVKDVNDNTNVATAKVKKPTKSRKKDDKIDKKDKKEKNPVATVKEAKTKPAKEAKSEVKRQSEIMNIVTKTEKSQPGVTGVAKTEVRNQQLVTKTEVKSQLGVADVAKTEVKSQAKVTVVTKKAETEAKSSSSSWTRDEDKTMLQVLKGDAGSEQVFGKINELLPHRSVSEIKERFCHVMTLLQQMAVGEVT